MGTDWQNSNRPCICAHYIFSYDFIAFRWIFLASFDVLCLAVLQLPITCWWKAVNFWPAAGNVICSVLPDSRLYFIYVFVVDISDVSCYTLARLDTLHRSLTLFLKPFNFYFPSSYLPADFLRTWGQGYACIPRLSQVYLYFIYGVSGPPGRIGSLSLSVAITISCCVFCVVVLCFRQDFSFTMMWHLLKMLLQRYTHADAFLYIHISIIYPDFMLANHWFLSGNGQSFFFSAWSYSDSDTCINKMGVKGRRVGVSLHRPPSLVGNRLRKSIIVCFTFNLTSDPTSVQGDWIVKWPHEVSQVDKSLQW